MPAGDGRRSLHMDRASASTVTRLSSYYRLLGDLQADGVETVSSDRLAERGGLTSAQVRKDLSCFGNFGRRGLGYNVVALRHKLAEILGLSQRWRVALLGAGNLGLALFAYKANLLEGNQLCKGVNSARAGMNVYVILYDEKDVPDNPNMNLNRPNPSC